MEKHFIEFLIPGVLFSEDIIEEIGSWDTNKAVEKARSVKERTGIMPFGFRFITRSRGPDDLDSKVSKRSNFYYLGGQVRTLREVEAENNPDNRILLLNMKNYNADKIIVNSNSWTFTNILREDDVILDFTP